MSEMMHENQIPTSPDLVSCLLHDQAEELADLPITRVPSDGTDNALYRVGEHHVVRLPIIDWAIGNEAAIRPWLPLLREHLSVDISAPMYYGAPACGYDHEWTIYPWIPGEQALCGCDDVALAQDVADFLHELRAIPTVGAPLAGRAPHNLDADVRSCLSQLLPEDHPEELLAIWDDLLGSCTPWDSTNPVWMHGDLAPTNMLLRNGRLAAVIDWSALGIGDPMDDLRPAWNMFTGDARTAFRKAMQVDDNTWIRAKARAFAQASFQLPYYLHSNPGLAAQAKYVFGEMLAESGQR